MKMNTETMVSGNRGIIITEQDGGVTATSWVNCRNGFADADITAQRWSGRTMTGARRWARKQLGLAQ